MVDFHGRPASVTPALRLYRARSRRPGRMFVEEPLPPEDVAGLAADHRSARRCRSPPASGWSAAASSTPSFAARAFDIAQPDICHTGGLLRGQEDRGHGRDRRHRARAAQSARADRRRRGAAFRHVDAQRHHPGRDVGRRALVRRGRAWPIERKPRPLGGAAKRRARHRGRRGRHRQASVPAGGPARRATPCWPTAPWSTGERHGGPSAGQDRDRHRRRPGHRRGDRARLRRARAPRRGRRDERRHRRGRRRRRSRSRRQGAVRARPTSPSKAAVERHGRPGRSRPSAASTSWSTMPASTSSTSRWTMPDEEWRALLQARPRRRLDLRQGGAAGDAGAGRRRDRQHRLLPRLQDHPAHLPLSGGQARAARADAGARHRIRGRRHPRERDRAGLHRDADRAATTGTPSPTRQPSGSGPTTCIRPSASAGRRRSR